MDELRAKALMQDAVNLLIRKNRDYGSLNISKTGVQGVATRLLDKASRLVNLTRVAGSVPHFEPLADTFMDIVNYGIIGLMLNEGSWEGDSFPDIGGVVGVEPPMVYLAGPIDDVTTSQATQWRKLARLHLHGRGYATFDPTAPYGIPVPSAPSRDISYSVIGINKAAIAYSSVVIANLSGPGKAIGTVREIEFAKSIGRRVIVILSNASSYMALKDVEVANSIEEAVLYLPNVESFVSSAT